MHQKQIASIFTTALIFSMVFILSVFAQNTLSKDETRFDLDGNGQLNATESDLMTRVLRIEQESGLQFNQSEIREIRDGQRNGFNQSRGGGRSGRSRGSRTPTGPRLNPEQVQFKDGAATIPDRETFKKLSYQGTDVKIDTQLIGIAYVKFQVERTNTENPQLYFMNTKTHRSHGSFMQAAGIGRGQGQMRGVLSFRPLFTSPNGENGVYTFEFNPNDAFPYTKIKMVHDLLVSNMPVLKNRLGYCPLWGAIGIYKREKALYDAGEFPVYFEDDLYANIGFLPLNMAESYGILRMLDVNERPTPRDIVICKTLPNEMPRVAGIITGVRQTPLSHVNLRALQDQVPNAFINKAWESEQIKPLIGKYVYYKVNHDGFVLTEATEKDVETHFSGIRPANAQTPKRNLSVKKILPLDDIGFSDSSSFGVKTANVATLRTLEFPDETVPDGYGVPFYFYDEFMKHNNFYSIVKEMVKDIDFLNSQDQKNAELKKFRKQIREGEIPVWMMNALTIYTNPFLKTRH